MGDRCNGVVCNLRGDTSAVLLGLVEEGMHNFLQMTYYRVACLAIERKGDSATEEDDYPCLMPLDRNNALTCQGPLFSGLDLTDLEIYDDLDWDSATELLVGWHAGRAHGPLDIHMYFGKARSYSTTLVGTPGFVARLYY
jgi:hypothetical protein